MLCASLVPAQDDVPLINREYPIKAGYLYQIAIYTIWPDSAFANRDAPQVIGVMGNNPFGKKLDEIARRKRVGNRPIQVRYLGPMDDPTTCHILFMGRSVSAKERAAAIRAVRGRPVLLVGETTDFIQRGGTLSFFVSQNKVRFDLSQEKARQQGVKFKSPLLDLWERWQKVGIVTQSAR
jgi:hypothetical protein